MFQPKNTFKILFELSDSQIDSFITNYCSKSTNNNEKAPDQQKYSLKEISKVFTDTQSLEESFKISSNTLINTLELVIGKLKRSQG